MAYDRKQFEKIIRDTLGWLEKSTSLSLLSDSAVNLLLGTAAQESRFGTYLFQIKGPALGVFQIEPATFDLVVKQFGGKIKWLPECHAEELKTDLVLSITVARLLYYSIKAPLPAAEDKAALAAYWNQYYNRNPDKGTDEEFLANYDLYVK